MALPTVAFRDASCDGQAVRFLSAQQLNSVEQLYESASDDARLFLEFSPWCLTMVDITRAEAHRIVAGVVQQMRDMEILSFRQGYWGRSYASISVIQPPDVLSTDFIVAEVHGPDGTVNPYHFGFVVFEYDSDRRWLRLHSHRYTYVPGG